MICELCKKNNATQGMGITLTDVNGTVKLRVCQPCLKKLKNAYKDPRKQNIEIYPEK